MRKLKAWISQYGIILDKNNKMLLLRLSKRADPTETWIFSGGRLNEGEEPHDGLRREIKEETSLEVEIVHPCGVGFWDRRYAVFFLCRLKSEPHVTLSNEHQEYGWFSVNEICRMKLRDKSMKNAAKIAQKITGL